MVRFRTYLQSGFSPTIQVIIHTNSPHTRQCSHTLLLVLPVASLSKMAIGANNKCMFTFGTRCINRTANIKPRQGLQCKILHGISIEFPYFRENRLCILHCSFQHIIQSQTLAHFLSEYLPALFPLIFISIQATKIWQHFFSINIRAACILVWFQLVHGITLLHEFIIERRKHIGQGFFQWIGTDTEIGIRKDTPYRINIILQADLETGGNVIQHIG